MSDSTLSGGEWVELTVHDVDLASWMVGKDHTAVTATHGNGTSPAGPYLDHGSGALFTLEDGFDQGGTHGYGEHRSGARELRLQAGGVVDLTITMCRQVS